MIPNANIMLGSSKMVVGSESPSIWLFSGVHMVTVDSKWHLSDSPS